MNRYCHTWSFCRIFVLIALSYPLSLVMLTSHQEHRFLLVTLPLLNLLVAQFWEKRIMYEEKLPSKWKFYWSSCFSLSVVLHVLLLWYLLLYHQVGSITCFVRLNHKMLERNRASLHVSSERNPRKFEQRYVYLWLY